MIWPLWVVFGVSGLGLVAAVFTNTVDYLDRRYVRQQVPEAGPSRLTLDQRTGRWRDDPWPLCPPRWESQPEDPRRAA